MKKFWLPWLPFPFPPSHWQTNTVDFISKVMSAMLR